MTTQQRATKGGQLGANGEWYEGGKFIATTDHAKRQASRRAATRKQNVGPYQWEVAPADGLFATYSIRGLCTWNDAGQMTPTTNRETLDYYGETWHGYTLAEICDAYNAGEKWLPKR